MPIIGALVNRYKWRLFRRRFDELRLRPILDYSIYRQLDPPQAGGTFRFLGGFESVTDGQTLWIRGDNLTIPVSLTNAQTFLLPMQEAGYTADTFYPEEEAPEQIRWDRVSALTEGARVFIGGSLLFQNDRWSFVSTRENPLMVIFFDGPDHSLTSRAIRAGRRRNEYWNSVTPYSLIIGALCQILIAVSFLSRPAFRLTVITALTALFTPFFPLIPPGLLFTIIYRRLSWRARLLRAYRDLARLPLRYLEPGRNRCLLPDGETYGVVRSRHLPPAVQEGKIPLLLPECTTETFSAEWYVFGALRPDAAHTDDINDKKAIAAGEFSDILSPEDDMPSKPADPFATFGALPEKPEVLVRRYTITAYTLEAIAWILLLAGIGLNIFFLRMILNLL